MDWSTVDFSVIYDEVVSMTGQAMPTILLILAVSTGLAFLIGIFKNMIGFK
jgi:hypothetical protein